MVLLVFIHQLFAFFGFSSVSLVISSIGFGGGVVAIVHPIHAPMPIIAMNAMKTGTAIVQNRTALSNVVSPNSPSHSGKNSVAT